MSVQCVSALRCVFSTRRVSQIIEFHLGGLAQHTLSVLLFSNRATIFSSER